MVCLRLTVFLFFEAETVAATALADGASGVDSLSSLQEGVQLEDMFSDDKMQRQTKHATTLPQHVFIVFDVFHQICHLLIAGLVALACKRCGRVR